MKKLFFTLFLITFFLTGAFCQNGIIRELAGEVELRHAGASSFVRASAGDDVALNTIISTGFRSTATIAVGHSLITVRPLTRLSLAEIQSMDNTENVSLNLQTGRIRVDVNPPAGQMTNFTVQSPVATASVRGTSFEFDTVNLSVEEGRVFFSGNTGSAVIVAAGGASFVRIDGTAIEPAGVEALILTPPAPIGTPLTDGTSSLDSASGTPDQPAGSPGEIGVDFSW
jgi:hypothetical protein